MNDTTGCANGSVRKMSGWAKGASINDICIGRKVVWPDANRDGGCGEGHPISRKHQNA